MTEPAEVTFAPFESETESAGSMPEPDEATFAPIESETESAGSIPELAAFSTEDNELESTTPLVVEPEAATITPITFSQVLEVEKPEATEAETTASTASDPAPEPATTAKAEPQEEPVGGDTPSKAFVFEPIVLETPVQPAGPPESQTTAMPDAPDLSPPATEEAIWTNAAAWTEPTLANEPAARSEPVSPPAQPPADTEAVESPTPTTPVIEQMVISPSGDSISVEPSPVVHTEPVDAAPTSGAILDAASRQTGEPTFEAPQPSTPVQSQPTQEPVSQPGSEPTQPSTPTREDRPPAASENGTTGTDVQRDDLTVISSITEETQRQLYNIGVTKLDEMARWSRGEARRVSSQVNVSEETIMHQWIFEAQSVLFNSFQDKMARKQGTKQEQ